MREKKGEMRAPKIFFIVTVCLQILLFFLPLNKGNNGHYSYWQLLNELKDLSFFETNFNNAKVIFFIVSLVTFFCVLITVIILTFLKKERAVKNLSLVAFIMAATSYAFIFGMLWDANGLIPALYGFNGISLILSFLMIFSAVGIKVSYTPDS